MIRGPPARSRLPQGASSSRGQSSRISPSPRGACSSRSPSPQGACSSRERSPSPQGACSSRSPSPQGACSSRSPSPQGACSSRSPSPQRACRSPSLQEACSSRSPSLQEACSSRGQSSRISPSPWGACRSRGQSSRISPSPRGACRSPSPQGACSSRSPSPQGACSSRSPSPQEACGSPSPREACRSQSPQEACRSQSPQEACRSQSPQAACSSRSPSPQGATSRSPSPQGGSRSPSPQGGCSSRSPSPQGTPSRSCIGPEISDQSNSPITPTSVSINQSNGNVARASTTPTRVEEQPRALSSPQLRVRFYGVKVRYFAKHLKSMDIKSFLTEEFMFYGKVVAVTVDKNGRSRYGLVFYKQKHERDRALKADITGPSGIKPLMIPWKGLPPCIFGIKIRKIDNNVSDLPERIKSEFGIFGDIALVQGYGPSEKRFSLVFYKYQEGQQKALAAPNPFETSFGNVFVSPWNKPPPLEKEMPFAIPPSQQGASRRRPFPQRESDSISIGPKISDTSKRQISPTSVSVNQSNGNVARASTMHTRAEEQPTALSSPGLPVSLYGVKVAIFEKQITNLDIKSFLTETFMFYGNVMCVTVHGNGRNRYGLVFYKQKNERDRALTADITGPSGIKPSITPWGGLSPCIFGIVVTNIDNDDSDLRGRIKYEFSIFGDITLVQIRGPPQQRFALVFYKFQEGQEKALASPSPMKTSLGNVTVIAWNKPPPPLSEMEDEDSIKMLSFHITSTSAPSKKDGQEPPPAAMCSGPPTTMPPAATRPPVWRGPPAATRPPVWRGPPAATRPTVWRGPPAATRSPVWRGPPAATRSPVWRGPPAATRSPVWRGPPAATRSPVWRGPPAATRSPVWQGPPAATRTPVWQGPPAATRTPVWRGPPAATQTPVWSGSPGASAPPMWSGPPCSGSPVAAAPPVLNGSPFATAAPVYSRPSVAFQPERVSSIETKYENCKLMYSSLARSDSPHTSSRDNRSLSPFSRHPRSRLRGSYVSENPSPHTRARYSRSRSPCSNQLYSECWHKDEKVSEQSSPQREQKSVCQSEVSASLHNSSLIRWIDDLEETI